MTHNKVSYYMEEKSLEELGAVPGPLGVLPGQPAVPGKQEGDKGHTAVF